MAEASRRARFSGPALVRLLARLADIDATESKQALPDRLSQWLGWSDAITLSAAHNGEPPPVPPGAPVFDDEQGLEVQRLRATLAGAIDDDSPFRGRPGAPAPAPALDYVAYRQHYVFLQKTMDTAISPLRVRLRAMLAARAGEMTRLAVVDALMERTLSPRERVLFGKIPTVLERRFRQLRDDDIAARSDGEDDSAPIAAGPWLDVFRQDMRGVLRAELDVRLQPVEGLLAALRGS